MSALVFMQQEGGAPIMVAVFRTNDEAVEYVKERCCSFFNIPDDGALVSGNVADSRGVVLWAEEVE